MKHTSKILALVLVVMTVLMSLSVITASAEEANTGTVTKVFEASLLEPAAQGAFADGQEVIAGTDDFFTLVMSAKVKIDSSSKTFEDGYKSGQRLNWGGKSTTSLNLITFTVDKAATVKVWWASGGDGRTVALWDADGNSLGVNATPSVKNSPYLDTYSITGAGTYSIACPDGSNYIFKVEVSWSVELVDPNACVHEWNEATCTTAKNCPKCGTVEGEALGHEAGAEATCTTAQKCTRCDLTLVEALGHTLTFVNTLPTAEAAGKTIADCSVCGMHFESDAVGVMTDGKYVLDAADLAGIAQYSLFDGEVKVVDGVFSCHLSNSYRTDASFVKDFDDGWSSTHRMNFGGASAPCNNGEGEEAVSNGGFKNFVQIVTAGEAKVTIYWNAAGSYREVAVYEMDGKTIVAQSKVEPADNKVLAVTTLVLPKAGAYLIGNVVNGNYWCKVEVEVHEHSFAAATCTAPETCECGEEKGEALGHTWVDADCDTPKTCSVCGATEGEALGHTWVDADCDTPKTCSVCAATEGEALGHDFKAGACSRCEAEDPDYTPEPPVEEPKDEEPKLNFFQKIIAWFTNLFSKIFGIFKK